MKKSDKPRMELDQTSLLGVRNLGNADGREVASKSDTDMAVALGRLHSKVGVDGEPGVGVF